MDALAAALRLHGATPMEMIVEPILRYGDVPEAALRAMEAVDVAIWVWPVSQRLDQLSRAAAHAQGRRRRRSDGAGSHTRFTSKVGRACSPPITRAFPTSCSGTIARKVKAIVAAGSKVTISGPNGTQLVAE